MVMIRKNSFRQPIWSSVYLAENALMRDLKPYLHQLQGNIFDLGCGNRPYQPLLSGAQSYVAYDLDPVHSLPDIVGVSDRLPFADRSFDAVLCTQVLEHVPEPLSTLQEIQRIMRPNGTLLLSAPQAWRIHEKPYDFYRYTLYGLEYLLKKSGFQIITFHNQGGAWLMIGQVLNNTLWRYPSRKFSAFWWRERLLTTTINIVASFTDRFFSDSEETMNYVILAKRA